MLNALLMILLFLTAVFLILLVLIQRGRGGGLAGAFGGLGGQSAFGTKAGDLFTRVTIGVAAFWIVLCALSVKLLNDEDSSRLDVGVGKSAATDTAAPGASGKQDSSAGAPAGKEAPPSSAGASTAPASTAPAANSPPAGSAPAEGGKPDTAK